jgi:hypothetical protein
MDPSLFTARADLGLAWGVKDSFLQYIRGMRDGDIRWGSGAAVTSGGEFFFPLVDIRRVEGARVLSFRGVVTFTAHRGLLSVTIAHPRLRLRSDSADLVIRVGGVEDTIAGVELPPQIQDGDVAMWLNSTVALAENGATLFGGTYSKGEQMAPLTVRAPARALGQQVETSAS